MAKQKSTAQADPVDPADQVQVAITANAAHDGVEYVINTQRFVDREIAKLLCAIGVAKEVVPPSDGAESNTQANGDEAGSSAAADPAEPTETPAGAAASDGV